MNSKKLDPILVQALANQEAYDAGIAPFNAATLHHDMNKVLSALPQEEARKLRRKFRKMWRKLVRKNIQATSNDLIKQSENGFRSGLGQPHPKEHHHAARKVLVYWELNRRARVKAGG